MKEFITSLQKGLNFPSGTWDPDKFDWKAYGYLLPSVYSQYFHIWWDPEKVEKYISVAHLTACSQYFPIWWRKGLNIKDASNFLIENCIEYFHVWWNPDEFNWLDYTDLLLDCLPMTAWWSPGKVDFTVWYLDFITKPQCKKFAYLWLDEFFRSLPKTAFEWCGFQVAFRRLIKEV